MTAQMGEVLIIDGEKASMTFCPPLPLGTAHVEATPEKEVKGRNTACWRGYVGVWEIRDGKFYLNDIKAGLGEGPGAFRKITPEPLLATWFTGVLRVPRGKQLRYVHMGFGSVYENEEHFKIENGEVVARELVDTSKNVRDPLLGLKNLPGGENKFDGDDW